MEIELIVVGIRNYCGGDDGIPGLFDRLPLGSEVFLQIEPPGTPYPGAIYVFDEEAQRIGSIKKTQRHLIEPDLRQNKCITGKIARHSLEDKCLYITVENTLGYSVPDIKDVQTELGEVVFAKSSVDLQLEQLTNLLLTRLRGALDEKVTDINALIRLLEKYSNICCASIDGNSTYNRTFIVADLRALSKRYPELHAYYADINDKDKHFSRYSGEKIEEAFLELFGRISQSANAKSPKTGLSPLEEYVRRLEFTNGGELNDDIIKKEKSHLSMLLAKELGGQYIEKAGNSNTFARELYYFDYSMDALYVILTRRLKLEHLEQLLEGNKSNDPDNQILDELMGIFYGDREEARAFLMGARNMKPKEITDWVNRLVKESKISNFSHKHDLWKVLNDHGIYPRTESNWNTYVK